MAGEVTADSTGGTAVEALGEQALSTAPLTRASTNLPLVRCTDISINLHNILAKG
jgi:hypothetical protein